MTNPPRKRGDPAVPTKADLERFADKIGQQIQASEERTGDRIARVEAQGNARQEVNVKAQAEAAAKTDGLAEGQRQFNGRLDEVVATNLRGYRTLESGLAEAKAVSERQAAKLAALEERAIPEVAEIAEGVKQSSRDDRHRLAGLIVGSTGLGAMATWLGTAIFTHPAAAVKILHFISLGLVKVTAGGGHE